MDPRIEAVPTPSSFHADRIDPRALAPEDVAAWTDLADRAIDPNPFFRPQIALANMEERGVPLELLVVRDGARWVACLPVRRRPASLRMPFPVLESMTDEYTFLGTPLLDPIALDPAADALLSLLDAERTAAALVIGAWAPDGPAGAALARAAARRGRAPTILAAFTRAAWQRAADGPSPGAQLPGDDRKELARRTRRLRDALGAEPQVVVRTDEPAAWDAFLAMENTGWKAERGTALGSTAGDAAFFRRICAGMAAIGRFEMLALEGGGRTVAMECHLLDRDVLFSFKIAHDPAFRAYSPGTQLKAWVIDRLEERGLRAADSCAAPDNAHMNRLWPGRRPLQVIVIPTGAPAARLVRPVLGARLAARRLRDVMARRAVPAAADEGAVRA